MTETEQRIAILEQIVIDLAIIVDIANPVNHAQNKEKSRLINQVWEKVHALEHLHEGKVRP